MFLKTREGGEKENKSAETIPTLRGRRTPTDSANKGVQAFTLDEATLAINSQKLQDTIASISRHLVFCASPQYDEPTRGRSCRLACASCSEVVTRVTEG